MAKIGLSERDLAMISFVNYFGKSYGEVLHKCFFPDTSLQVCKNRLSVLKNKYKIFKHTLTGAISPKYYISLSEAGKRFVEEEMGENANDCFFALTTLNHSILEQLTYFALTRAGKEVVKTNVSNWSKQHHHTPDFYYKNGEKLVYIEVEISKKTHESYNKIFANMLKDDVSNVIYIAKNEKWKNIFLNFLPKFEGLRVADIETFFDTALKEGKIIADKQKDILNG